MSTTAEKKSSLLASAGTVSGATSLSRILGLVREQVMAYFFGASMATDAFITAFRIPNLLRDMFAEGALSSAFVPVFKDSLVKDGSDEAFKLGRVVLGNLLVVVGLIVLLGILAAPAIIYVSAHGFVEDPEKFALTVSLTRLMFAYLLLVSLSAVVMGMLNSFGRFGIPALSPALFNLGIIGATIGLYHQLEMPVYALAIGVLIGGLAQLAIQLPLLWRIGFRFKLVVGFLDERFKRVVRLLTPMIIGLSAGRINILVSTLIASLLAEGAITYLSYAFRLMHFPLGVFAVALGTVALPKASELASQGNTDKLATTYVEAINLNFLVIMPSAAFLALWGRDLVELVFQYGAFTPLDTENTARALLHYSYGLIGLASVRVTVPFFYSLGDSKTPTRISVAAVALNLLLYLPLVRILDFAGLSAATSIAALANFTTLAYALPAKGLPISRSRILLDAVKIALAAGFAVYLSKLMPLLVGQELPGIWQRALTILIGILVGGVIYIMLCILFRVKELRSLLGRLKSFGRG